MKGNFQLIYLNQSGMNYNTRPNYNTNPKFHYLFINKSIQIFKPKFGLLLLGF